MFNPWGQHVEDGQDDVPTIYSLLPLGTQHPLSPPFPMKKKSSLGEEVCSAQPRLMDDGRDGLARNQIETGDSFPTGGYFRGEERPSALLQHPSGGRKVPTATSNTHPSAAGRTNEFSP